MIELNHIQEETKNPRDIWYRLVTIGFFYSYVPYLLYQCSVQQNKSFLGKHCFQVPNQRKIKWLLARLTLTASADL